MNPNRLQKFQKLLDIQGHQVDRLRQQIAVQDDLIESLRQEHQALLDQMQSVGSQFRNSQVKLTTLQQSDLVMVDLQKQVKAKKIEISTAEEKSDHLLHSFREENRLYKSWEKLIDRKIQENKTVASVMSMKETDDLYLIHHAQGNEP